MTLENLFVGAFHVRVYVSIADSRLNQGLCMTILNSITGTGYCLIQDQRLEYVDLVGIISGFPQIAVQTPTLSMLIYDFIYAKNSNLNWQ